MGIAAGNNVFKLYDIETGEELESAVSVELPAMELVTNSYKGAGVGGVINVLAPGVLNEQIATMNFPQIAGNAKRYMKLGTTRTVDLRNEIIVIDKDTHANVKVPYRWILKGPLSQANPGTVEQATAGEATIVMQVYYIHCWLDGVEILEWDAFKGIYTVDGEDLMAETRRNVFVG